MKTITSIACWVFCAMVLLWAVACNDDGDKGTDPPQPKDYPVYISDANLSRILIYHPIAQTLDTVVVPWSDGPYELTASADGSLLYAAGRNSVAVIDTTSFSIVRVLPYPPLSQVAVSADGRFLAITGDNLHILSTGDYSVVYSDTVKSKNGVFSVDGRQFYCTTGWSATTSGVTHAVDLSGFIHQSTELASTAGGVLQTVPSQYRDRLLRYLVIETARCAFEVYDTRADSAVFREMLQPGYGKIALTVDGRYAIYTNCGIYPSDYPPAPGTFTIFDIAANSIHDVVFAYDSVQGNCVAPPDEMAVTPDGKWLILLGGSGVGQVDVYLYDLENETIVDHIGLCNESVILVSVTTQLIP